MLAGTFDYPISHLRLLQSPCIICSKGLAGYQTDSPASYVIQGQACDIPYGGEWVLSASFQYQSP